MPKLILLKPLITEKTMRLAAAGQFTFLVRKTATKAAIAEAVETLFKVNVVKVETTGVRGKRKRTGKRRLTVAPARRKKAVAALKPGQSIEYFQLPEKKK